MSSVPRKRTIRMARLLPAGTLFFACGILLGRHIASPIPALIALGLCLLGAACLPSTRRSAAALAAVLCIGAGLGWKAYHPALPEEGMALVQGTVVQEVALRKDGQVQTILQDVTLDGQALGSGAYWTYYLKEGESLPAGLSPGAQVTLTARIYHPGVQANPGGFDFREYLLQRGVTIGLYGAQDMTLCAGETWRARIARIRSGLSGALMDVMGEEAGAYAAAMLLGSRDFLQEDDRAAFNQLGIAHILSVSGYHVGVLAALLLLVMKPLGLHRGGRMLAEGAVLFVYCLLTGGNAPVIRAAILLLLRETSLLRHKQILPLHVLCATACVQLLFTPTALTSASFQLSYGAMLGLLLLQPRLSSLWHCRTPWGEKLRDAFCASLSAQIGVLLPQLYWFGDLPLLSLALNMLVMAIASGVMTLYWLTLAALPIPGLREALGTAASWLTRLLLNGVRFLARFDFTSLWTRQADSLTAAGWVLLMLGLGGLLPRALQRKQRLIVLLGTLMVAAVLIPLPPSGTSYIQFSAGNADAALLVDEGTVVVIDTGETGQEVAGYLHQRRLGVDVLILTHLHSDHAGGLRALLDEGIPVDVCCLPVDAASALIDPGLTPMLEELAATGAEIRTLSRGDVLALPSGSLTALWPIAGSVVPGQDANDFCLALLAELHGTSMLLASDLSGQFEGYIQTPADVLKAAHHGSSTSTSQRFLEAVQPQLILLSNADAQRHQALTRRAGEIPILCTEECGAVTLRFEPGGVFRLETFLPR